jgi:hypothetical protein
LPGETLEGGSTPPSTRTSPDNSNPVPPESLRIRKGESVAKFVTGGSLAGILTSSLLQVFDLVPVHAHPQLNGVSAALAGVALIHLARSVIPLHVRFGVNWQIEWRR